MSKAWFASALTYHILPPAEIVERPRLLCPVVPPVPFRNQKSVNRDEDGLDYVQNDNQSLLLPVWHNIQIYIVTTKI